MKRGVQDIVVVGGGTAGWITASLLAAEHAHLSITLIESPDVPSVGVGEGSWPTLRSTLQRIGLSERDFLLTCDASFKQGSRFDGWVTGASDDRYLHPFAPLPNIDLRDLINAVDDSEGFSAIVTPQSAVCEARLAPKQPDMPEYAGALNYGYHLDATKLAALLRRHAIGRLGVRHLRDHVTKVDGDKDADIISVETRESGRVAGDLFIDCTGHRSILLGEHYGINFQDKSKILFNDTALTMQCCPDSEIASQTISTAHSAGWIWDIGLPTRRGVGLVYASGFMSEVEAEAQLLDYTGRRSNDGIRKISFQSGYRARFWHRNCLAIGLSAGFLEPLEASAIVLVELSAQALSQALPPTRPAMNGLAARFNATFQYRWERIIDFLKLHYVMSQRKESYWTAHRDPETQPDRLRVLLDLWAHHPPSIADLPHADEIFPAASYAYVLYGMGYETKAFGRERQSAQSVLNDIQRRSRTFLAGLPKNRALLDEYKRQADKKAVSFPTSETQETA